MTPSGEEQHFDWRRGGAAAGGLIAALVLLAMVFLVAFSNRARERALEAERRAYNIALVVRTSGNIYYSQWRLAGRQISELERLVRNSPEQRQRVAELQRLYNQRTAELALAARAAAAKQGQGGTSYYYMAGKSPSGPAVTRKLDEIAASERQSLRARIE